MDAVLVETDSNACVKFFFCEFNEEIDTRRDHRRYPFLQANRIYLFVPLVGGMGIDW